MGTALDDFFAAYATIQEAGFPKPQRPTLNFRNATVTDNPTNDSTDILLSGGSGGSGVGAGQSTATLVNGLNSNVPMLGQPTVRIIGPSAAFSVGGFNLGVAPVAGQTLTAINTTAQPLTVVHEDLSSTAVNRIDTGSAAPVTMPPRRGRLTFVYDGTSNRWCLENGGINYKNWIDVRDFGAVGDGVTDDTAACQAALTYARSLTTAFAAVLQPAGQFPGVQGWVPTTVYFPRGVYKLSAPSNQACLEVGEAIHLIGDGMNTVLQPTTTTAHTIRHANLYQRFEDLNFVGGNSAIVSNGPSRYYGGQLGSQDYNGLHIVSNCWFEAQAGPSYYTDVSAGMHPASSAIVFDNCFGLTSCFFLGAPDNVTFRNCYLWCVQAPFGSGANPFCPIVNDDSGNILGFIVCYTVAILDSCIGVPVSDDTRVPKGCWLQGTGTFRSIGTRFGGETQLTIAKTRTNTTYRGINWGTIVPGNRATWEFDACPMASAAFHNWLEIYDSFPASIDVRNTPYTSATGNSLPQAPALLMQSLGIWIDSVSCPQSSYTKVAREAISIRLDPFTMGQDFRFRTSNDPTLTLGQAGVTDMTAVLRRFMSGSAANRGKSTPITVVQNHWPGGRLQLSDSDTASGAITAGSTDTLSGYVIQGFHATGPGPTNLSTGFNNVLTSATPPGEYTLSAMVRAAYAGQMGIYLTDAVGATNPIPLDSIDFSNVGWQRLETTFYWDGTTYAGSGSAGVQFQFPSMPAALDLYAAFFALHEGRAPAPWNYPGNVNVDGYFTDTYYGATTPSSGTYKLNDVVWNTNAIVGQPAGWKCIRAGSYGGAFGSAPLWASFGTLVFDPSTISSYNFDYDAASLAPGPITTWPSKYGGTDTVARYALTGTATAHAAGGTGPNGAAYVSGNGTSDGMTEDNQSSQTVAKEIYFVAKYDTTGGSSGTIIDGGTINSGRIYRPGVDQLDLVFSGSIGPFSTASGATEQWHIWHVVVDGTNGSLDLGGVTVMPTQAYPTTSKNGVTLLCGGGGGNNFAQASIARVIGFADVLTSAQRTQMVTYLQTLYGVV